MLAHTYGRVGSMSLGVYFLDADGLVVMANPQDRWARGTNLAEESHIRELRETRSRSVSMPFRDPASGRTAVALATPILRADGSLQAIIGGLVDMSGTEVLGPLGLARDLGRTGHAELVDGMGMVIASTEPDHSLRPGEHVPFYTRMFHERRWGVENVPYAREDMDPSAGETVYHVMAFAPLSSAPWGVAIGGSDWETFAPVRRLQRSFLLGGALALLVLWGLTLLVARALVRPLNTLTKAAARMAADDLDQPIRLAGEGEIAVLAESLEVMRGQMRRSLEAARQLSRQLESRVQERTEELAVRNRQLAAVTAVATAANEARDLARTLERCLDVTLEQTGMEAGAVRLRDPATKTLVVAASRGEFSQFPCWAQPVGPADCPCGHVAQHGAPVFLSSQEREQWSPACRAPADHAVTVLPLRFGMETLGVLYLSRARGGPPRAAERETLDAVANQLATAIRNARLLEELGRVQAQHELDRMKAEFISVVSHELRTPLGIIKGYATTLLRPDIAIDSQTQQEFLEAVTDESDKLNRMIEDLLDASRLQAGRFQVDRRTVSLRDLVQGALAGLEPQLTTRGHLLRVSLPAEEATVLIDPARFEQVIRNLVDNADRYSEPGTAIEVDARRDSQDIVVSVRDYGDGIPSDEMEEIFGPFYRGRNARRRGASGTGLGLAICRGIVEAHGGRLWAESAPGEGSVFTFSIPPVPPPSMGGSVVE